MRVRLAVAIGLVLLLLAVAALLAFCPDAPRVASTSPRSVPPSAAAPGADDDDDGDDGDEPRAPPPREESATASTGSVTQLPSEPAHVDDTRATIIGYVVDKRGAPVTSFEVVAVGPTDMGMPDRSDPLTWTEREVHSAEGRFEVALHAGADHVSVEAPRFRRAFTEVLVADGETKAIRIVLDDSNALTGTVRNAQTGAPIKGAVVMVWGGKSPISDADGRFASESLPDGTFQIEVTAEGYRSFSTGGIRGDRGRDEHIDIKLEELSDGGPTDEYMGFGFRMEARAADGTHPYVAAVTPDTPAASALHVGDDVVDVDGVSVEDQSAERVVFDLARRDDGVRVGVRRDGRVLHFDLERARIAFTRSR